MTPRPTLAADDQVSVVIISSAVARAFCVGADLKERRGVNNDELLRQRQVFEEGFRRTSCNRRSR